MKQPRYPHPWLARVAWLGMGVGLFAGLLAAGATLLPPGPGVPWYGSMQFARWRGVATVRGAWEVGVDQFETTAAVVTPAAGWVLAAGLLRLVATGRLGWVKRPHGLVRLGRWVALGGLVVALLVGLSNGWQWYTLNGMSGDDYSLPNRVKQAVEEGRAYRFSVERVPGDTSRSVAYGRSGPTTGPSESARRIATAVCTEGYRLFLATRAAGVLFFLSGVVYCLGRPDPDAAPPVGG